MIVTDDVVAPLHLPALRQGLAETGIAATEIVVPAGEASKSLDSYVDVLNQLLDARVERRTAVIALGGGVVGDLAGFAAATALRGLPFVQMPTTLLAQVDSSVGGKTGVNTRHGKNLAGAFYQPRMVLADTATLATLPPRELRAGYAEIAKAGMIGDAAFFAWCERPRSTRPARRNYRRRSSRAPFVDEVFEFKAAERHSLAGFAQTGSGAFCLLAIESGFLPARAGRRLSHGGLLLFLLRARPGQEGRSTCSWPQTIRFPAWRSPASLSSSLT